MFSMTSSKKLVDFCFKEVRGEIGLDGVLNFVVGGLAVVRLILPSSLGTNKIVETFILELLEKYYRESTIVHLLYTKIEYEGRLSL